ncbi:MAG: hypothetical protein K9N55_13795 [Phycisphaerae bacterium]|nr:hypothetical protein [Phycisphaerae bacterium]
MTELKRTQNHIQRILAHRAWPMIMAILAMVTCVPALWTGLFNDDFLQRAELIAPNEAHQALAHVNLDVNEPGRLRTCLSDLFIAVGPHKNRTALLNYGALPWWTGPNYKVALLRPVATLTHWLDSHWLGDSITWMHLHNVMWLGLVMLTASAVYRTLMPAHLVAAGLALLFLALDSNHYFPALWIANRNQLMALVFALLSLIMHHQWRIAHRAWAAVLSALGLLASLLCAEGGVAGFAFLFAYALCLDRDTWIKRALSLMPAFVVIVLWRLAYSHFGYGAQGGGFYFDPAGQPLAFAQAALQRGPFLLAGLWYAIPPDLFAFMHDAVRWPYTASLWGLVMIAGVLLIPLLRHDRTARFWCVAMGVAIVPVCAAVPMGRNLLFASIAGFALMAQFICGVLTKGPWLPEAGTWRRFISPMAWFLLLVHGVSGIAATGAIPKITQTMMAQMDATYDLSRSQTPNHQDLVIVNAPNPASMIYMPYRQALTHQSLPARLHMLAPGYGPLQVTRPDDHSLRIKALEASLLTCRPTSRLEIVHLYRYLSDFRAAKDRFAPGEALPLPGLSVTVESMDTQGQPIEILVRFDTPLTEPTRSWLRWDWQLEHYEPFVLPAVGQTLVLKGPY